MLWEPMDGWTTQTDFALLPLPVMTQQELGLCLYFHHRHSQNTFCVPDSVPGTRDTMKSGFHKVLLWWGLLPWRRNDKQSNRPSNGVCGSDSFEFLTDLYRMPRAHMLQMLTLCWTSGCVGGGLPISGTGLQQFRVNPGVLT